MLIKQILIITLCSGESLGSVLAEDLEKHLNYNLGGGAMGSDGAAARP